NLPTGAHGAATGSPARLAGIDPCGAARESLKVDREIEPRSRSESQAPARIEPTGDEFMPAGVGIDDPVDVRILTQQWRPGRVHGDQNLGVRARVAQRTQTRGHVNDVAERAQLDGEHPARARQLRGRWSTAIPVPAQLRCSGRGPGSGDLHSGTSSFASVK